MKKMMAALLAVLMLTLTACGSAQTKTVDAQALADALVQGVKFDGAMSAMSADELRFSLAEMPDCTAAAYKSDGTTKEIVVVAQCADSAAAATGGPVRRQRRCRHYEDLFGDLPCRAEG